MQIRTEEELNTVTNNLSQSPGDADLVAKRDVLKQKLIDLID